MAQFVLDIADADVQRVTEALCTSVGLSGADITPENARQAVMAYITRIVVGVEQAAAEAAVVVPPPVPPSMT